MIKRSTKVIYEVDGEIFDSLQDAEEFVEVKHTEKHDNEIVDMILEDPLPHIMEDPDIDINDLSVNQNGKWKWIINDKVKPK